MPRTLAVILNYNGAVNTGSSYLQCIDSLINQSVKTGILIIDNHSSDNSIETIRSQFPHIDIIVNKTNMGTAGYNTGIEYFTCHDYDYMLLSNNDMVYRNDFIEYMTESMAELNNAAVLTPLMLMKDRKTVNSTGIIMNRSGYAWDRDFGRNVRDIDRPPGEVIFATGGAMFLDRSAANAAGLFDPLYFAYYEDNDYCMTVRLKTGRRIYFIPNAVCYHDFSASWSRKQKEKDYLLNRNRFIFVLKFFPLKHMFNALRHLYFTKHISGMRGRIIFDLFSKLPMIIVRRLKYMKYSKEFPHELMEDYHGMPRMQFAVSNKESLEE
ncbi:MAG: glycosyltransferase family 2 protein [bacterium]